MAVKLSQPLEQLLRASLLGGNKNHPLAGWQILTILYHDGGGDQVRDRNYLLDQYNQHYLARGEAPLSDAVLKPIMVNLSELARLVEVTTRKVRTPLQSGHFYMHQASVYRITSGGIEYLTMMQRVVDAETTVTANIARIDEFCQLVSWLNNPDVDASNAELFNKFKNMLSAYADVMKGMHKLDEDLDELTNDLAFNHGSKAASHLQRMLNDKAMPAFAKLLAQGQRLLNLQNSPSFSSQVAHSRQGSDSLDVTNAIDDRLKQVTTYQDTQAYVRNNLQKLTLSFNSSSEVIDSSLDSVYLLFHTIKAANDRLSKEYDTIQNQTVDIQQLTSRIDQLLKHYQTLAVEAPFPRHVAQDRELEDAMDYLAAGTMGPVKYTVGRSNRVVMTEADNPEVVLNTAETQVDVEAALTEFKQLVMRSPWHGKVTQPLTFHHQLARDEVVRLASAMNYTHFENFAPFGRPVRKVVAVTTSAPVNLRLAPEQYQVWLPHGFEFWFAKEDQDGGLTSK